MRRFVLSFALVVLVSMLGACASVQDSARPRPVPGNEPLRRISVVPDASGRELLAQLLAAEIALDRADERGADHYVEAARLSDDPAIAEQATRVALATRQWELARGTLARWEALRGGEGGIRQARAMIALHDGKQDVAYPDLLWLAQRPDGSGWLAISQVFSGAEDKPAAGAMLQRLLAGGGESSKHAHAELLGDKPQSWILASQLAARLERKDLAQTLASEAVVRFHTAEAYAWAAQIRLTSGDRVGAKQVFAEAMQHDPTTSARGAGKEGQTLLRIAYAKLLAELGDNLGAARALAQGRQNELTYGARAAYLARIDDKSGVPAISALYSEVIALPTPRPSSRVQLLGQLAELLERKGEALKWYALVPSGDEHWFAAQLRTAVLLNDGGKASDAIGLLHELQARSGDNAREVGEAYMLEAELLNRQKRGDEAIAAYDRGLQVLPDDTRLIYARALLNDDLDHIDAAVRDLRRVLELKPEDADAMNALGYTLADRTGEKSEALVLIQKALVLKPGEPAIMDSLGWVQYRLGDIDAALTQLRVAYQKQPDAEIAAHLGEVLWVSGRKDEARKVWDQGRKKDGANKVLIETIRRLAS
ncbi:MAG: tetratricopeptide repeat protein [Rudaea sp.]